MSKNSHKTVMTRTGRLSKKETPSNARARTHTDKHAMHITQNANPREVANFAPNMVRILTNHLAASSCAVFDHHGLDIHFPHNSHAWHGMTRSDVIVRPVQRDHQIRSHGLAYSKSVEGPLHVSLSLATACTGTGRVWDPHECEGCILLCRHGETIIGGPHVGMMAT